jgi:hypothetical protein
MEPENSSSKFFVRIIDILYGVTIGNGIVAISSKNHLNLPQDLKNLFSMEFFLFLFALFIVFKDLIGYNQAIRKRPHKCTVRFVLDVGILFVFFFLIRSYDSWGRYLFFLGAHFILALIWTAIEGLEWRSEQQYGDVDAGELKADLQLDIIACFYLIVIHIATSYLDTSYLRIFSLIGLALILLMRPATKLYTNKNRLLSFLDPRSRENP